MACEVFQVASHTHGNVLKEEGTRAFVLAFLFYFQFSLPCFACSFNVSGYLEAYLFFVFFVDGSLLFAFVPFDGQTVATELGKQIVALHSWPAETLFCGFWLPLDPPSLRLCLSHRASTKPLLLLPIGHLYCWHYSCTACYLLIAYFSLYAAAGLDGHSALRCSSFACALRFSFPFSFLFDFVSAPIQSSSGYASSFLYYAKLCLSHFWSRREQKLKMASSEAITSGDLRLTECRIHVFRCDWALQ